MAGYDKHCPNRPRSFPVSHHPLGPKRPLLRSRDFDVARLAMNRHLYGKTHGPPLAAALNLRAERRHIEDNGVTITEDWAARVIGGELYLRGTVQVYQTQGRPEVLWDHLIGPAAAPWYSICLHVGLFGRPWHEIGPLYGRAAPSRAVPAGHGASMKIHRRGKVSSCKYCYTDFHIDVRREYAKGWVFVMTAWHGLGACRSPSAHKWRHFIYPDLRHIVTPRIYDAEAGDVYRAWRKDNEGVNVDLEQLDARFVNDATTRPRVELAPSKHKWGGYRDLMGKEED